jgi:hypothetical protein
MPVRLLVAAFALLAVVSFDADAESQDQNDTGSFLTELPIDVHGFYEIRAGYRTRKDKYEKDMSIMENRLQLDASSYLDNVHLKFKGDFLGDLVEEQGDFDLREAFFSTRPADFMDLKAGRQILTWGTGDLVFINDLFPKDWNSFFIGRDTDYLKAPSDAVKASFFSDLANLDVVFTPQFDPDRFIDGRRVSYWNSNLDRLAGQDAIIHTDKPNRWFKDSEIAARVYKNIDNYELALYAYRGFWKSPSGQNDARTQAIFPDLNVYGASSRFPFAKGLANLEFGYYQSADDESGEDPLVNNCEFRYLAGYTREIARDFTAGLQYYLEQMADYAHHKASVPAGLARDRYRHLFTIRLTKLLLNQNLRCSMFTYYSPSDQDAYIRPNVNYKVTDNLSAELGANVFFGDHPQTFFGQFQNDTNIYSALRYSF